jgi:hypothetical protein
MQCLQQNARVAQKAIAKLVTIPVVVARDSAPLEVFDGAFASRQRVFFAGYRLDVEQT